jgi:predicted ABC-type ATPase
VEAYESSLRTHLATRDGPTLVVLCGSNGAGKSTFYRHHLAALALPFINADEIARTLHPEAPEAHSYEAMLLAEQLRQDLVAQHQSFCMETVLSDTQGAKLGFLQGAHDAGYAVVVIYIRLVSPALSMARVDRRVRQGGHNVPADKLMERFPRTQANAAKALQLASFGLVLDNSNARDPYRWKETWSNGQCIARA